MVLLGYEVGANIDMTGDGNIGGDKFLCRKVCNVQRTATRNERHFTVIGLTNLLDEPIFFILVAEGKEYWFDIRSRIDLSKEKIGDEGDGEE